MASTSEKMTPDEYLVRVEDQIEWYDQKSGANKVCYTWLQTIVLISSAVIPVISFLGYTLDIARGVMLAMVALLGGMSTAAAGILSLYRCQELRIKYRTTAESLKSEKYHFLARAGCYAVENAFQIFVENCEALISRENATWQNRAQKEGDGKHG